MQIKTPAKVNPYLRILRRLENGAHEVDLALVAVSLYDDLEFQAASGGGISLSVESSGPLGPVEDNLVFRAAKAFEKLTNKTLHIQIHLRKNIPAGAGLGGGSGNAAGTLVALNAMHGLPLTGKALAGAARQLGADVPYFLDPTPHRGQGLGDLLSPLHRFPRLPLIVVQPPFSVSTGEAYRSVTDYSPGGEPPPMTTLPEVLAGLENQFEAPLFAKYPEIKEAKSQLLNCGASGALLSGSGSALFAVFQDETMRAGAAERLELDPSWQVFFCETLARHTYLPEA